ncbi:MAG: biopolymer transporter ExbD [Candidatus Tectomicrobia bacterium]|nr:biopolymer transporter ExbD [Candidatus Tectomicrobia bacterium]
MQLSNGQPRRVTLDLTPLIDVVLMLVIFFMLTTTFVLSPGVQVDLPQGSSLQKPRESDAIITITKDGAVYFQDAQVSLETLQAVLQRAKTQQPRLRVVIKADTQVQHGRVVEVMDMAKRVGIERLAIATAPKQAAPQPQGPEQN